MTVGERIRAARKNAGMKQSELAEKLGVAVITIGQYERGKREPRTGQLGLIANALGIPVSELLVTQDYGDGFHAEPGLKQATVDAVKARISELKEDAQRRKRVNAALDQMNETGVEKVADYAEDILPRYRAPAAPESAPPAREGKDTTPPPDTPETPPEGK